MNAKYIIWSILYFFNPNIKKKIKIYERWSVIFQMCNVLFCVCISFTDNIFRRQVWQARRWSVSRCSHGYILCMTLRVHDRLCKDGNLQTLTQCLRRKYLQYSSPQTLSIFLYHHSRESNIEHVQVYLDLSLRPPKTSRFRGFGRCIRQLMGYSRCPHW